MKETIYPDIVTNEQELKLALDNEATVIYIEPPLYHSILDAIKKSAKGKFVRGGGLTAVLLGLLVISGPLAWVALLGGTAASILGKSMDSLKDYSVKIDEVCCRIILYRKTGANKYKASKHEIYKI